MTKTRSEMFNFPKYDLSDDEEFEIKEIPSSQRIPHPKKEKKLSGQPDLIEAPQGPDNPSGKGKILLEESEEEDEEDELERKADLLTEQMVTENEAADPEQQAILEAERDTAEEQTFTENEIGEDSKIYQDLIQELRSNRVETKEILERIRNFGKQIDILFPDTKDFKSRHNIENKMKIFSDIISAELGVVKQLDDSIKSEFQLRQKAVKEEGFGTELSISELAEAIAFSEEKKKKKDHSHGKILGLPEEGPKLPHPLHLKNSSI